MSDDSFIQRSPTGSVLFAGPDGVAVYRALVLSSALRLLAQGIQPNRYCTVTSTLRAASEITRKPYKRNQLLLAAEDLQVWAHNMELALPTTPTP